ncbi:hypothetical protein XENORESO_010140, partial [Xenotaenia resolanae]
PLSSLFQLFHCVGEVETCVRNSGKVGFEFSIIQLPSAEEDEGFDEDEGAPMKAGNKGRDTQQLKGNSEQQERLRIRPGLPKVIPAVGYIGAGSERHLRVLYLPGIPEVFEKQFQLQVAFLPPQEITLTGVGVIPRIRLNLPRNLSEECYSDVLQQAQAAVEAQRVRQELEHGIPVGRGPQETADCAPT